jgi:FkbM family methyltransferase
MKNWRLALGIVGQPARIAIRAKRLLAYVRRFGAVRGPRILFKALTAKAALFEVRIPQARHPITLRSGSSDLATFEQLFIWEDYDLPVNEGVAFIIDAGANIGCATIYFANRFPNARIVAIEPDAENFRMLARNTSPYANVSLIQAGVWHKRAWLKIENPDDDKWTLRVGEAESGDGAIAAVTITDILAEAAASRINLLKIDIEGAEREVFSTGYQQWLDKVDVLVIELHDRFKPGCAAAFYTAIAHYDFVETQKGEHAILVKRQPTRLGME